MESLEIKNLLIGKPDAKDEMELEGDETFLHCYVMPPNLDVEGLVKGSKCFVTGFKGTGKTALLFYIDKMIHDEDNVACTDFVFFKEKYTRFQREEIEKLNRRIFSSITFDKETLLDEEDFDYIWRWIFLCKIVDDNETYDGNLFIRDETWVKFERIVKSIKAIDDEKKTRKFPSKLKLTMPFADPSGQMPIVVSPEVEVDLGRADKNDDFRTFIRRIDDAMELLKGLHRTDVPYYLFVDELEAYYGEQSLFTRDLRMIRDMIFTVRVFNGAFIQSLSTAQTKTKIICSVRSEIINAIYRYIPPRELNKVIGGFECPLVWEYNNTNSFNHPILQILIKRIEMSEKSHGVCRGEASTTNLWFPEQIDGIDPALYILSNNWSKPRDIVRLLLATSTCLNNHWKYFGQAVFDTSVQKYSYDSLNEISEELFALYSSNEVSMMLSCFRGYKTTFYCYEIIERMKAKFKKTSLEGKQIQIMEDLYRLGVIGNTMQKGRERWLHKGNNDIIIDDSWKITVHKALSNALSSTSKYAPRMASEGAYKSVVPVTVVKIIPSHLFVTFYLNGETHNGAIHISQIADEYVYDINEYVNVGDVYKAMIIDYNQYYSQWNLSIKRVLPITRNISE